MDFDEYAMLSIEEGICPECGECLIFDSKRKRYFCSHCGFIY